MCGVLLGGTRVLLGVGCVGSTGCGVCREEGGGGACGRDARGAKLCRSISTHDPFAHRPPTAHHTDAQPTTHDTKPTQKHQTKVMAERGFDADKYEHLARTRERYHRYLAAAAEQVEDAEAAAAAAAATKAKAA